MNIYTQLKKSITTTAEIVRSPLSRQGFTILAGDVANAAIQFLLLLVIARTLTPSDFGLFSLAMIILTLTSTISDLGLGTGVIKFASEYLAQGKTANAHAIFRLTLRFRLLTALGMIFAALVLAEPVAQLFFHELSLVPLIKLSIAGAIIVLLRNWLTSILIAHQQYATNSILILTGGIIRLIAVGTLIFFTSSATVVTIAAAYALAPGLILVATPWLIPRESLGIYVGSASRALSREVFQFSKWVTVSVLLVALLNAIDPILIGHFLTTHDVGIYNAAYQLAFVFPILTGAITTLVLPKLAQLADVQAYRHYLRRWLTIYCVIILPAVVVLMVIAPTLITLLFGSQYSDSVRLYPYILAYFALSILGNPASLLFYRVGWPQALTLINAIHVILRVLLGLFLIPRFGAQGAVLTALLGNVIDLAIIFGLLKNRLLSETPKE